jgi:hypothetical protein
MPRCCREWFNQSAVPTLVHDTTVDSWIDFNSDWPLFHQREQIWFKSNSRWITFECFDRDSKHRQNSLTIRFLLVLPDTRLIESSYRQVCRLQGFMSFSRWIPAYDLWPGIAARLWWPDWDVSRPIMIPVSQFPAVKRSVIQSDTNSSVNWPSCQKEEAVE